MIKKLMAEEMKKKGLSIRAASQEIGIAHTTIIRILDDLPIDLETMKKICTWLEVDITSVLNTDDRSEKSLIEKFAIILQRNPNLYHLFDEYYSKMEYKEVSMLDLEEILAFMVFRAYYRKPNT